MRKRGGGWKSSKKNIRTLEEFSFFEEVENLNQLPDSEQHKTNPAFDLIEGAQAEI